MLYALKAWFKIDHTHLERLSFVYVYTLAHIDAASCWLLSLGLCERRVRGQSYSQISLKVACASSRSERKYILISKYVLNAPSKVRPSPSRHGSGHRRGFDHHATNDLASEAKLRVQHHSNPPGHKTYIACIQCKRHNSTSLVPRLYVHVCHGDWARSTTMHEWVTPIKTIYIHHQCPTHDQNIKHPCLWYAICNLFCLPSFFCGSKVDYF